jgi:uncharacterized tellurite resistance protein B-like protein
MAASETTQSAGAEDGERFQIATCALLAALAAADGVLSSVELEQLYRTLDLGALSDAGRDAVHELLVQPPGVEALDQALVVLAGAPQTARAGVMLQALDMVEADDSIAEGERALLARAQHALGIDEAQRRALESYAATLRAQRRRGVDDRAAAQARRRARVRLTAAGVTLPDASDGAENASGWERLAAVGLAAIRRLGTPRRASADDGLVAELERSVVALRERAPAHGAEPSFGGVAARVAELERAIERQRAGVAPTVALAASDPAPAGLPRHLYSEVRGEFLDADVLMFHGKSAISRVFQAGGGSKYSHAGLVAWWGSRAMLLHAQLSSICAVPLGAAVHEYDGAIDWYRIRPEHRSIADVAAIVIEAQAHLGLPFAKVTLLRTMLNEVVGLDLPDDCETPDAFFCCQYVARAFRVGGLPLQPHADMAMLPSEIAMSPVLRFMGALVPDLDAATARRGLDRP